eukprot:gnl/TRDRNA2_/TRDRNA2_157728_c0_seq1.p1 gnl/TRDRNA2_/TRDRNA2_157728_c0~~gnl/TRDRNA2_/TRDRNA2_157728_c0_seq1.p1  ORF type:complete len:186 (-),score=26.27 gnl/TRDRNA2_/TRDRNA2_157728_c0_seq1:73-630(-)
MSHRSVWESVATRVSLHNLTVVREENVTRECLGLMRQQAEMYNTWETVGKEVNYDMFLDDFLVNPEPEIQAVAQAIGICENARKDPALLRFFRAMASALQDEPFRSERRLMLPSGRLSVTITQMHPPTSRAVKEALKAQVQDFLSTNPACSAWAKHNASITWNPYWNKFSKFHRFRVEMLQMTAA